MPRLTCSRIASCGSPTPAISARVSRRRSASAGEFACRVDSAPSWPVLSAVSRSSASPPAHLADHDPVRSHAQRVAKQVANRHLAAPLDARRAALQAHDVGLAQAKLGRVLDRDHALLGADVGRQRVEQRRLAGPGATRDQDAAPASNGLRQQVAKLGGERARGDQLVGARARAR